MLVLIYKNNLDHLLMLLPMVLSMKEGGSLSMTMASSDLTMRIFTCQLFRRYTSATRMPMSMKDVSYMPQSVRLLPKNTSCCSMSYMEIMV